MDNEAIVKTLDWEPTSDDGEASLLPHSDPSTRSAGPAPEGFGSATERRREISVLGRSLVFKGEFEAEEDLMIDGRVEGTITHRAEHLTIGPHGNVRADIVARHVLVQGRVVGNIRASETIVVEPSANVAGNLIAPRIGLKEGAQFDGNIQMKGTAANAGKQQPPEQEARNSTPKRSSSSKKAAGGARMSDSGVDDLLE
jgi:cytoskeletal protein CcmA (bactofilin family)